MARELNACSKLWSRYGSVTGAWELRLIVPVHLEHERFANCHWHFNFVQRLCSTALWTFDVSLVRSPPSGPIPLTSARQIMVWEAFFSSLTHMSCLTFLRSYLYRYPGQRLWRLLGMLTIAGLLFTAMLPTYNFNISQTGRNPPTFLPRPADQTICFFRPGQMSAGHTGGERTVAAMVLLVVGFFFRSVRLFESTSTGMLARWEQNAGRFVVRRLEAIYTWCNLQHTPYTIKRTLLYWPLIATRWTIKIGWDFTTSMYFEVCCSQV
jgi:hypothetical protein